MIEKKWFFKIDIFHVQENSINSKCKNFKLIKKQTKPYNYRQEQLVAELTVEVNSVLAVVKMNFVHFTF